MRVLAYADSQVAKAPTLVDRVREVGTSVGRGRVIGLQSNPCADARCNPHSRTAHCGHDPLRVHPAA